MKINKANNIRELTLESGEKFNEICPYDRRYWIVISGEFIMTKKEGIIYYSNTLNLFMEIKKGSYCGLTNIGKSPLKVVEVNIE